MEEEDFISDGESSNGEIDDDFDIYTPKYN